MGEGRRPRGRMPAKIKATVRLIPADYATTWKPLVDEVLAKQAKAVRS